MCGAFRIFQYVHLYFCTLLFVHIHVYTYIIMYIFNTYIQQLHTHRNTWVKQQQWVRTKHKKNRHRDRHRALDSFECIYVQTNERTNERPTEQTSEEASNQASKQANELVLMFVWVLHLYIHDICMHELAKALTSWAYTSKNHMYSIRTYTYTRLYAIIKINTWWGYARCELSTSITPHCTYTHREKAW